ncbi:unnamed protein product [Pleuronectes platessa]|uniref:Muscle-restricted coiled-coil protein n=1 Tax=Pleuronectes platessa TaxID=8262 RepID=A0A9N7Y521_PLEPL|nr:unnamed protein product [Pleuronectes platessa]
MSKAAADSRLRLVHDNKNLSVQENRKYTFLLGERASVLLFAASTLPQFGHSSWVLPLSGLSAGNPTGPGPAPPTTPRIGHSKPRFKLTGTKRLKILGTNHQNPPMDQHKYRTAGVQEKLEIIGVEDEAGNPISALTILSLLERVAGIIDNVQSCQQRMEERQLDLESNIKTIQGDVLKLAKDHTDTSSTVEKLLQKTRKVSANVKEVRARVEKQNVRVKKVESTQDELLTRNKFRVVIYQVS